VHRELGRPGLECAARCFDAAIVLRRERRRQKILDLMETTTSPRLFGDERAAVVGLEDERRAVQIEQTVEVEDDVLGALPIARRGQEREVTGEVADDQDVMEVTVDGFRRLREVGGPDRPRGYPAQPGGFDVMVFAPSVTQRSERRSRDIGEQVLEGGNAQGSENAKGSGTYIPDKAVRTHPAIGWLKRIAGAIDRRGFPGCRRGGCGSGCGVWGVGFHPPFGRIVRNSVVLGRNCVAAMRCGGSGIALGVALVWTS
jgi:hypothetical protein